MTASDKVKAENATRIAAREAELSKLADKPGPQPVPPCHCRPEPAPTPFSLAALTKNAGIFSPSEGIASRCTITRRDSHGHPIHRPPRNPARSVSKHRQQQFDSRNHPRTGRLILPRRKAAQLGRVRWKCLQQALRQTDSRHPACASQRRKPSVSRLAFLLLVAMPARCVHKEPDLLRRAIRLVKLPAVSIHRPVPASMGKLESSAAATMSSGLGVTIASSS